MLIGIMQGRLSNKSAMPLQSFPWDSWEEEFVRASSIGFNQIEWLLDGVNDTNNPIASVDGRKQILYLSKKYSVNVKSLCAHTFIDGKLLSKGKSQKEAIDKLSKILTWAFEAKIDYVILPVMDAMSIRNSHSREKFKEVLCGISRHSHGSPKILLESDLPAFQLKEFIDSLESNSIGVLYDLGNATAMGFNLEEDLKLLSPIIKEVHIKDRFFDNGNSGRLGTADTPFHTAFRVLKKLMWSGSFILETPIFNNWENEAKANFSFTKNLVESVSQELENGL